MGIKKNSETSTRKLRMVVAEFVNSMGLVYDPSGNRLRLNARSVTGTATLGNFLSGEINYDFTVLLNAAREAVGNGILDSEGTVPGNYGAIAPSLVRLAGNLEVEDEVHLNARDYVGKKRMNYGFEELFEDLAALGLHGKAMRHSVESYEGELEALEKSRNSWRKEALQSRAEINSLRNVLGLGDHELPGGQGQA